jgi:hypothetical protein
MTPSMRRPVDVKSKISKPWKGARVERAHKPLALTFWLKDLPASRLGPVKAERSEVASLHTGMAVAHGRGGGCVVT